MLNTFIMQRSYNSKRQSMVGSGCSAKNLINYTLNFLVMLAFGPLQLMSEPVFKMASTRFYMQLNTTPTNDIVIIHIMPLTRAERFDDGYLAVMAFLGFRTCIQ